MDLETFKKMKYMSEEIEEEDYHYSSQALNEDHRIHTNSSEAEACLLQAYAEFMRKIQMLEYKMNTYPYGEKDANKVIHQAKSNMELKAKLKRISDEQMQKAHEVINEVLGGEQEGGVYAAGEEEQDREEPFELGSAVDTAMGGVEKLYSKNTEKKKPKDKLKMEKKGKHHEPKGKQPKSDAFYSKKTKKKKKRKEDG